MNILKTVICAALLVAGLSACEKIDVNKLEGTGHCDYESMKPYIDIAEKAKTDAMDAMEKALKG